MQDRESPEQVKARLMKDIVDAPDDTSREEAMVKYQNFVRMADPNSHMKLFENKKPSIIVVGDDEADELTKTYKDEKIAKQVMRRNQLLPQVISDALVNRVSEASGPGVKGVTFDEFIKYAADPDFVSLAKYSNNLFYYANGTPRPKPLRPLIENEMGMYKNQIIFLTTMPGDKYSGKQHAGADIGVRAEAAEPAADE